MRRSIAMAALVLAGCASGAGGASGSATATGPASGSASATGPATGSAASATGSGSATSGSATAPATASPPATGSATASWPTFGGASTRASIAPGAPAHPRLKRRFARSVDGQVYAQPLISGGRIYVATQNNTVFAFTTGGRLVWKRHLGAPVPRSDLPCGNIDPTGITGTPVLANGRIYAVAFLRSGHKHVLYGLRLRDGRTAVKTRVDPANPLAHQQRGALLAAHGRIYIPYGGLFGDCGPYHGNVISTTLGGRGRITFKDPSALTGIWAPAGISRQGDTQLVSTGNGSSGLAGWENAVIRLSPGLRRLGYWAPTDWRALSSSDTDESSLAPLPVSGGNVFQIGKDGVGYLLSNSLGGVGGEKQRQRVCSGGAFGADAFRAPLAIVPCGGSVYALRIGADGFSVEWRSDNGGMVPVIAGDSVFALTRDGTLVQLRMSDGSAVNSTRVGAGATSFPAPAVAGGTLVAPTGRGFVVFGL